jgi:thermitase
MRFEKDRPGYAFEEDYRESYGPSDLARLRVIVSQQVGQLGASVAADAQLLGVLIGRRCANGAGRAQVETRARRDGSLSILAHGEVLLPAADVAAVRDRFSGYRAVLPDLARDRAAYVRMCPERWGASVVDRKIDECAVAKVAAAPNYLATMAAVSKGVGGPEPAEPPAPEPDPPAAPHAVLGTSLSGNAGDQSGAGPVRVAVIDTGIAPEDRTDSWLRVQRLPGNIDELDVLPAGPDGLLDYSAGHGTFVSGIVQRVAPQAQITMYRAADTDGFATDDGVAAAILQAHADGAQIINLSMGIRTVDDAPPPATAAAVATVLSRPETAPVIVASAGNYGDQSTVYPAALPGVHAVAGLTAFLTPAPWSSYGGGVAFSTVAEGIRSTYVRGTESPVFDPSPDTFSGDAWAVWSGTSFAAPQVAGAIARISYEENVSVRDGLQKLADFGKEIPGYGKAMRILKGIG